MDVRRTNRDNAEDSKAAHKPAQVPAISLPKGGGAIRGVGEKFSANAATGTGTMSVPVATSPGRSGFGPKLSLSYDSGAGNDIFGLGWRLALPAITRKTDKGLPQYRDACDSDTFILSGSEDLVPVLGADECGQWQVEAPLERVVGGKRYRVRRYRPRIEGLFARIERWTHDEDEADSFWRTITRDNVTTWYGRTPESRIADPDDPARIFSWRICESHDDKGNVIAYGYKPEDSQGIDRACASEKNRSERSRGANRYPKQIFYGNRTPYFPVLSADAPFPAPAGEWLFEVVFDYGEHGVTPLPTESAPWTVRNDPFSSYRSAFEMRTYRLCQRVLMFHHFPDEPGVGANCLVRSTDLTYSHEESPADARNPVFSRLVAVTQRGYRRTPDGYFSKAMPAVEFEYSQAEVSDTIREVDGTSLANLPQGIAGASYRWVDLDGEGISGVLSEQGDQWFYKRNLSPGVSNHHEPAVRFAPVELITRKPSLATLASGRQQLIDLAGDGQLDLVEFDGPAPGFFERTQDPDWQPHVPFESLPTLDWRSENLKFVDLTGDGHADILISEDEAFCWHASLAEAGFGPAQRIQQMLDEEKGPRLVFADDTDSIFLADFSGDGLTDLVRIRNGEVCYWPNLGYGRFGARVQMDHAPWFDAPDLFDTKRLLLADIDGSGLTDIVYLSRSGVQIYFNQSGNGWSRPENLTAFPAIDNTADIGVMDLLGNGTACLVWSSPLLIESRRALRYVDLMGGRKPHLLVKAINNLGAETHIQYAPSTRYYVADKLAGHPWLTRIPFPVHVVDRIETIDRVSRNRFVTRFAYHHGYFDGEEREFRGFGMVEQWDTEEFAALDASERPPEAANVDAASHLPPVLTKTWYHTGAYSDASRISRQFENEYWLESDAGGEEVGVDPADARQMLLADTVLPRTVRASTHRLTEDERREACRALKGATLRQEIYALDDGPDAARPFKVSESTYEVQCLQPRGANLYAVFLTHVRETIECHYERRLYAVEVDGCRRQLADPRVGHTINLQMDEYGNVLLSAAIAYGRRHAHLSSELAEADLEKQRRIHVTFSCNRLTNAILGSDRHRTPLPGESRTYELLNAAPAARRTLVTNLFSAEDLRRQIEASATHDIVYQDWRCASASGGRPGRRLIEHIRALYRRDDLSGALPAGTAESLALLHQSYQLALTPGLIESVFGHRLRDEFLASDGGYVRDDDGNWWIPSEQTFFTPAPDASPGEELRFAREHFFLPHRVRTPFHSARVPTETVVAYDRYDLLIEESRDALGNRTTIGRRDLEGRVLESGNDYRVLQATVVMDANRNCSAAAFDALGMVVARAVGGKPEEALGDSLEGFNADLSEEIVLGHLANPTNSPGDILQRATSRVIYDLFAYQRTRDEACPQPAAIYSLARETHESDLRDGEVPRFQHGFSYTDGFGREIQKKLQAEPDADVARGHSTERWVGSGWFVFNNKGKPVREYEPFFSATHRFEFAVKRGVGPILFYDPVSRLIATRHPDHTWEKVVFDPWHQENWDVNDTVLRDPAADADVGRFFQALPAADYLPTWYQRRALLPDDDAGHQAADQAAQHADSPMLAFYDTLGRPFLSIADNKGAGKYATRIELDTENNQRVVVDARNRVVMQYDYDMVGNRLHQAGLEAGERWILKDITGNPIRAWSSKRHAFRTEYDALRRPVRSLVAGAADQAAGEIVFQRTVYGEERGDGRNHRTRIFQIFDSAGVVTMDAYDFKGNLLQETRRLTRDYHVSPDWSSEVETEAESFVRHTTFDALDRPTMMTMPDQSRLRPGYNAAGLLESLHVNLRGADTPTQFVRAVDYDAKGQRRSIEYGNGVRTRYSYDAATFRLERLATQRGEADLQDLHYTYDPAGNITRIHDSAQQTIFFRNQCVEARGDYVYDAIYRLIQSSGREQLGLGAGDPGDGPALPRFHPDDGQAMGRYFEKYEYDEVGNFLRLLHRGTSPAHGGYTREYSYDEPGQLDPGVRSNRLSSTRVGAAAAKYTYDAHGNTLQMPHLPQMSWDFKDQLQQVDLQGGGRAFYTYDAGGQRVRKVREHDGATVEETLYLGGFEIYRKRKSGKLALERHTLHVMDDKQRIALVETKVHDSGESDAAPHPVLRYQFSNHLGTVGLELDADGAVISYEEYFPFGGTSYQAGRNAAEVSLKRYRYSGKERDEETGLYYHGARYYAPWLARWISIDPALIAGVSGQKIDQSYQYVENRPLVAADPDGGVLWFAVAGIVAIASLTIVSDANAPEDAEAAKNAKPSIGPGEFAGRTAVVGVSWFVGGGVGSAVYKQTGSYFFSGLTGGFYGGVTQAPADLFVQDVAHDKFHSAGDYANVTLDGGFYGGLTGGAFGLLGSGWSKLRSSSGSSNLPGRTPLGTPEEAAAFDAAGEQLDDIIRNGGQFPDDTRAVGAVVVDVPGYNGPTQLRGFSAAATDSIGEGAQVCHAHVPLERTLHPVRSFRGGQGGGIPRINDFEVKGLEAVQPHLPPDAKGTLHLKTMRTRAGGETLEPLPACPSCTNVLFEFTGNNPGLQVVVHSAPSATGTLDLSAVVGPSLGRPAGALVERLFPQAAAFLGVFASAASPPPERR